MKKIILIVLISFAALFAVSQAPHPALCFTKTGQSDPAFISVFLPIQGFEAGDWLGVYDADNMLCYGAKPLISDTVRAINIVCFGDELMTDKKDGFTYASAMKLFMYDAGTKKFYDLSGDYVNGYDDKPLTILKWYSLAIYKAVKVKKMGEIELAVDPELSAVVFDWVNLEQPVVTGGSDAVKLKFISQNTTAPTFMVAVGKGTVEKRWDGFYYKYAATDVNVVINAVGKNNFTGQLVTDKLTLILDQSVSGNTIFEDENMVFYLKGDEVWWKVKGERVSVRLYRVDNGKEKLSWNSTLKPQGTEMRYVANYSRSWKGQSIRFVYYYYLNGKMVKQPVTGSFVL